MRVRKRNGKLEEFGKDKIHKAIERAFEDVYGDETQTDNYQSAIAMMTDNVTQEMSECDPADVEEIQDVVEDQLMENGWYEVAKEYIRYRYLHELRRQMHNDGEVLSLIGGDNDYWNTENSNKNSTLVTVQRDYLAGITSTDIARNFIFSKEVMDAHDKGLVHQHDMDYMAQHTLHNCDLLNIEDMLQNGTVINNIKINKPHRLITAMTILTQIMASCAASQYGGQTINLFHVAPFVSASRDYFYKKYVNRGIDPETSKRYAEQDLQKEIEDAVQTFNYQISTLFTLNGQAPFCSVFIYLNEAGEYKDDLILLAQEFFKQRVEGLPNRDGVKVTQSFPKILYVLQEDNYKPGTPYWYVTEQAIKCSAQRLTPDYISEKIMKRVKVDDRGLGQVIAPMGCRSILSPFCDSSGKPKTWGRFNCGVSSINLPEIAFEVDARNLSQSEAIKKFFEILDERCEIAHKGLKTRIDRLSSTKANVAPILWMDGALARKDPEDTLSDIVHGGYSTASLGYVGIAETVKILLGVSNAYGDGKEFAKNILQFMNDKCKEWKKQDDVAYSVYGTPAESLCYKFATKTREKFPERFQELFGNKKYFENSYHIASSEEIDPFSKIKIEGEFQELSPGGSLSYIECSDVTKNIEALYPVLETIYNNIMYCEINVKTSYCHVCGNTQTIDVHKDENGDTWWECSICGNTDLSKMNVAARTCGYIGSAWWNSGKTQEIASRFKHLDDHEL